MSVDKHQVQRQFDRSAEQYDGLSTMQRDIVDVLMAEVPQSLNHAVIENSSTHIENRAKTGGIDTPVICDLGCGTGYALSRLSSIYRRAKLTGLDLAPAMLRAAEQRFSATQRGSIRANFIQGDIESLPFSPNSVDLCFSSSAIQWCNTELAAKQMHAALKPGGSALISSFLAGTLQSWRALWGKNDQSFLSIVEFERAISGSGLVLDRLWAESYIQSFDSFEGALKSVRNLGAGNASGARPKGLMSRARFADITAQVDAIIQQDGVIELNYQVVYAKTTKPRTTKPRTPKSRGTNE